MTTARSNSLSGRLWKEGMLAPAIGVVVALKIYVVAANGADLLGDYFRMFQFSDAILAGWSWVHDAGLTRYAMPPTLWKPMGYPLLMALARLLLGGQWIWGLFILQSAVSLIAGLFLRRLALAFGLGATAATIAFLMYEFSLPVSTDVLLMADSLYGSLATIMLAMVGQRLQSAKPLSLRIMAGAGVMLLICFFLREVFFYLFVPFGLALTLPALAAGVTKRRAAMLLLAFCLPTAAGIGGVMAWNNYRVGQPMLTSGGQTAFVVFLQEVAEREPAVFDGDAPLDRVARSMPSNSYETINQELFKQYHLPAPELARLTERKYFDTAERFPWAFLKTVLDQFHFRLQASLCGDVLTRLDDLDWWRFDIGKLDFYGGWRGEAQQVVTTWNLHLLTADLLLHVLPRMMLRAGSCLLFLLFALGLPLLVLRDLRARRPRPERLALLATLYVLYWCTVALHMLVNLEVRYLGPVLAIPILGSVIVASRLWSALLRSRESPEV